MITFADHQLTEMLHESSNSLVYRGRNQADGQPVVLKMLKDEYPHPEKIARFKREYELTRNLKLAGVVDAYRLINDHNHWGIVFEDFGGDSLEHLKLAGQLAVPDFLKLAIDITAILSQIHQRFMIHKDINPSNIVLNPTTRQIKIIDFGIATVLSRENSSFRNANVLEGTLAYISPEQTGRMNRAMDYRTDFYSLGVSFYELLTGQLPFVTNDALELMHYHIAKHPAPPHELRPETPLPISDIVMKLIAKNAEDRYQSIYGLKTDLERCLQQWEQHGHIEPFPLGRQDISDRFQIPQKLYGRDTEIETLLATFAEVKQGESAMLLVSGHAGIGKSALVQEVYKPITQWRGYFITGKFDQLQRDIPYSALIQAFQSLMRQLLTEGEAELAAWREKLLTALGPNGQVIIDVIPEVKLIIGPQPQVPDLSPAEAQNRFNLVFQEFIQTFTRPEHPLVIFLDDLQWADRASLKLVQRLMTTGDRGHLFLIGAYRDNEVDSTHPLTSMLDEVNTAETIVHHISLSPLDLFNITQLIADTFHCSRETASPLAELVQTKTQGNPFFMNEFLKSLHTQELVVFDSQRGGWQWELAQIQTHGFTDNVIELMAGKVQQLPVETQQVLQLAACLGHQFDLQTLSMVYEKSPRETAIDLWQAIAEDFILPLSDTYKLIDLEVEGLAEAVTVTYQFAHDRIQQAVYSLIPIEDREIIHQRVGTMLLRNTAAGDLAERLFDIVNQLNVARDLIKDRSERDQLVELNLQAGKKAKRSAAYEPAFKYLTTGIELLSEECWQRQYDQSLELYEEAAEAAYLSQNYAEMEQFVEVVLDKTGTLLDKIKAYEVLIQAYYAQEKYGESMATGRQVLKLLGVKLPERPNNLQVLLPIMKTKLALIGKKTEDLLDLRPMTNPEKLGTIRIMNSLIGVTWKLDTKLMPIIVCNQLLLLLKHGNPVESPFIYASYGIVLNLSGDIDRAYQFGQLALNLLKRLDATEFKAKTYMMSSYFARHLKEPLRDVLPALAEGYQSGKETGDFQYAAYSAANYCQLLYLAGLELSEIDETMADYSQALTQLGQMDASNWHRIYWQGILNLRGQSEDPIRLVGEVYDEEKMLPQYLETREYGSLSHLYLWKVMLPYRFQKSQQAFQDLPKMDEYSALAEGTANAPAYHLYSSLIRLAVFPELSKSEQKGLLKKVAANQKKLKKWAEHAPMNYQHKFYLVEAERARVLGRDEKAREYYDKAIDFARKYQYLNEESLAYELAARFYLDIDQPRLAGYYLRDAHYTYQRWGATAKVKDLEERYPQLLGQTGTSPAQTTISTTTTTSTRTFSAVDLSSVLKAGQAISGKIELDKLLATLMEVVIENAGAQKGYLILEKSEQWVIEAEGAIEKDEESGTVKIMQSIPVETSESLAQGIVNYVARTRETVVLNDAAREGVFAQDPYIIQNQAKSILCLPLINQGKLNGILYLENNLTTGAFTADRVELLNLLSTQAAISIENASLYSQQVALTDGYSRFVPREFLQFLEKESIVDVNLGDHVQQKMAILFSDIRSFTTLSEAMSPQQNFDFINAYFGRVSPVIRQHNGFIVKYVGDGMMAVFPSSVEDALNAAIDKIRQITLYNTRRQRQGYTAIDIGMGIHIGNMMIGMVGETARMQGDLFSDAVNLAARLEGLTKIYGASIIISNEVLNQLEDPTQYKIRFLGKVRVKGRQESVPIFELFEGDRESVIEIKIQTKEDFEKGLSLFYEKKFAEASVRFNNVLERSPNDKAARLYLERSAQGMVHDMPTEWPDLEILSEK